MDTGTFRGLITLILIFAFIGIALWAYSKRRKPDFDEAANLPLPTTMSYRPVTSTLRVNATAKRIPATTGEIRIYE
ncbi:hypothetical protein HORIV_54580 [Vreelandella olivaria]|uniref:CcoQ/FixQ family Cbb3-type cytochrome c oxidase assembly chaperone n=1 Tax=Vreelandella olivaria TaxID=390919 RepID=A0ABM7GQR7_9GAMM|nr:hypothetical protein HORIV_54580 [Halomonas olivaria]